MTQLLAKLIARLYLWLKTLQQMSGDELDRLLDEPEDKR